MKESGHSLSVFSLQKEEIKAEMADLIRSRTELQCAIDDLRLTGEKNQEKRFVFYFYSLSFLATSLYHIELV